MRCHGKSEGRPVRCGVTNAALVRAHVVLELNVLVKSNALDLLALRARDGAWRVAETDRDLARSGLGTLVKQPSLLAHDLIAEVAVLAALLGQLGQRREAAPVRGVVRASAIPTLPALGLPFGGLIVPIHLSARVHKVWHVGRVGIAEEARAGVGRVMFRPGDHSAGPRLLNKYIDHKRVFIGAAKGLECTNTCTDQQRLAHNPP